MNDFAKQRKEQKRGKRKQYKVERNEIQEQVKKSQERGNNSNTPWEEISNFEDEEFYGFCSDFEQKAKYKKK